MKFFILFFFITISIIGKNYSYTPTPLLFLEQKSETFFVLATNTPFKISKFDNKEWLSVENIENNLIEHKAISLKGYSHNYKNPQYSAIKIEFVSPIDPQKYDYITIPVVSASKKYSDNDLRELIPDNFIKFDTKLKDFDISYMITPGGHFIFEITYLPDAPKLIKKRVTIPPKEERYDIVFPWYCLEICGLNNSADIEHEEVHNNLDAVNSVSYERYTMNGGVWQEHNLTDPTTLIQNDNLETWPMINANTRRPEHDETYITNYINQLWDNRETLAAEMLSEAQIHNYTGYCLDVETQQVTDETQTKYIQFVNYLSQQLHSIDKKLMVCHAHWSTIAPMSRLANETDVDYVATMDPYTNSTYWYPIQMAENYEDIEPERLIWGFAWEHHDSDTQESMWQYMEQEGLNVGVAGAAVWRVPAQSTHGINYYDGFRTYYPLNTTPPCEDINCSNHGICDDSSGEAVCICDEGYIVDGYECIDPCEGVTCSNLGVCEIENDQAICICEEGYISDGLNCIPDSSGEWIEEIITPEDQNFKLLGPKTYWFLSENGLNDISYWCYGNDTRVDNSATWSLNLENSGEYKLYIYIPNIENRGIAKYKVDTGVDIQEFFIDQSAIDGWYLVGTFQFSTLPVKIELFDNGGNSENFKKIAVDSIKIKGFIRGN